MSSMVMSKCGPLRVCGEVRLEHCFYCIMAMINATCFSSVLCACSSYKPSDNRSMNCRVDTGCGFGPRPLSLHRTCRIRYLPSWGTKPERMTDIVHNKNFRQCTLTPDGSVVAFDTEWVTGNEFFPNGRSHRALS